MMGDHRTVSLGLMGKYFDKSGSGTVIVGDLSETRLIIEDEEIELRMECDD